MLFLLAVPASSFAIGIEAALGGWYQDPEGTLALKPISLIDEIDIDKEAGYDEEFRVMGRVKIDMPLVLPNIYVMATPMMFDGTGSKGANFKFGDIQFDAALPFSSEVTLNHYDIALYYGIPFLDTATAGMLNVELGLNARIVDFNAEVTGTEAITGITRTEKESFTTAAPLVYVGAQIRPVDWLSIEGEGRGIAYSGDHYYDLIGRVKVKPLGPLPVFISGGWRYEDIKIGIQDIEANVDIGGPFAEVGIEF
jgi:outer membrane protein